MSTGYPKYSSITIPSRKASISAAVHDPTMILTVGRESDPAGIGSPRQLHERSTNELFAK
jgi:hypothetical protein